MCVRGGKFAHPSMELNFLDRWVVDREPGEWPETLEEVVAAVSTHVV